VDRIQEMLSQIAELADADLESLESEIVSEFETVESQDLSQQVVDTLDALASAAEAVRNERTRRAEEQQMLTQKAAEAAARVHEAAATDMPEEETPEEEQAPDEETEPVPPEEEEDPEAAPPVFTDDTAEVASTETAPEAELAVETETETATELSTEPVTETAIETEPATELSAETAETSDTELSTSDAPNAETELSVEDNPNPTAPATQENVEAPVTAAADTGTDLVIEAPASHQPVEKASAAVTITAGADIPGFTAGSPMNDMDVVADAFVKRLHGLRRVNGGDGEQHIVASLQSEYPSDRMLVSGDAEGNWAKIQKVTGPEALVASGGYCAPLEVRYEVYSLGSTARPVRDALARFGADRGGIRFVEPPVLADYSGAVGIWTAANDASVSPSPATKPCLVVQCGQEITAVADAVTLCLQFGNLATRAYPEMIARHNELALIQHAREAEQNLLTQIADLGTKVTAAKVLGIARDWLVQIDKAGAAYRYRHRLGRTAPLRVLAPEWVLDAIRSDLAMQAPGDDTLAVADAKINAYLSARNINVAWSMDGTPGFSAEAGSSALDEFPATFEWDIFSEGSFLFLDGGTLDLGVIRDSTLVGTNDYKMFVETFEGVAMVGVESLHVTSTFDITGESQAAVDAAGS
jgi:chemotaxis protein histidine kinase CheA